MNGNYLDYGIVTTPQLHYMVYKSCKTNNENVPITDYYSDFGNKFNNFLKLIQKSNENIPEIFLDCSDGVGGIKFAELNKVTQLKVHILNNGQGSSINLNDLCGAEFVQKEKKFPRNFDSIPQFAKCASFDGDADRLVYLYFLKVLITRKSYKNKENKLILIDGDRLIVLFCCVIKDILAKIYGKWLIPFKLGIVQTAYANSGSTRHIIEHLEVIFLHKMLKVTKRLCTNWSKIFTCKS